MIEIAVDVIDVIFRERVRSGRGRLTPIEEAELGPVDGIRILHLQCHFGRDSLCRYVSLAGSALVAACFFTWPCAASLSRTKIEARNPFQIH
jgi:hypothetical protein